MSKRRDADEEYDEYVPGYLEDEDEEYEPTGKKSKSSSSSSSSSSAKAAARKAPPIKIPHVDMSKKVYSPSPSHLLE